MTLRFEEHEWPGGQDLIEKMQTHSATTAFYTDADQEAVSNTCYLEAPAMGGEWGPIRVEDMAWDYEMTITLRSITGPWDVRYWDEDE